MQIFIWPTAIISENQTFDRSTFNFFKNSIFSACYYHCYLFKCVDWGVGGRVMFALAWQPVTNWVPRSAHGLLWLTQGQKWIFSTCVSWVYGREKVPHSWSNSFLFYLYFQFVPPLGLISLASLLPTPWSQLSFDLQLPLLVCTTCSLIIIMANIYWILTMVPGTLQGALYVLFLLILEL